MDSTLALGPRVAGRFSDSETSWVLAGDFFEFNIKFFRLLWLGVASVLKKIVRLHRFFLHQISLESKLNGRQKVKGGHGSLIASLITLNLGVGCAPSCWPIFGFRNLLGARRGHIRDYSVQFAEDVFWQRGRAGELPQVVAA